MHACQPSVLPPIIVPLYQPTAHPPVLGLHRPPLSSAQIACGLVHLPKAEFGCACAACVTSVLARTARMALGRSLMMCVVPINEFRVAGSLSHHRNAHFADWDAEVNNLG